MADLGDLTRKLSGDILAALQLAQELQEHEVAERLLQALEIISRGDLGNKDLCAAYSWVSRIGSRRIR